ncbi:MAG: PH domain-containing protein [Patescibacteria group bacterium]
MTIAMSKTREMFPLSKKKIIKKTFFSGNLSGLGHILVILAIISIGYFINNSLNVGSVTSENPIILDQKSLRYIGFLVLGYLVFAAITLLLGYFYQKWYFSTYFYDLTDNFIIIRKGPITPKEISIPYERIQDVYVDQDFFDRLLGIYDVHLSSATFSSGLEAHIDGVGKEAADGLKNLLLSTIQQKIVKLQA